jgi:hypothetical protein
MEKGFPRYPGSGSIEQVKAENARLRQKLQEKGAQFSEGSFPGDDDEAENRFLKNVMEYEKQIEKGVKVRIFDKIGKPSHFKPAAQISDEEIEDALGQVLDYLHKYALDLDVCSPSVTSRELYRFAVEELFYHRIDDINVPGMITCFIYDEFHPDPVYDNTIAATEYCMKYILEKEPLQWMHHFRPGNLRLNDQHSLTAETLKEKVNAYKSRYRELRIERLVSKDCTIDGRRCLVSGNYSVIAIGPDGAIQLAGHWRVHFEKNDEFDNWSIAGIDVEGISF